jgi:hypothetical protein
VSRRQLLIPSLIVALAALSSATVAHAQSSDRDGVRRAVLDYVEGFYEGDTVKIVRSIRPEVTKYGFFVPKDSTRYAGEPMSFREMIDYAKGVKARGRPTPATAPKQVDILDVADQTAAAKLTAWWGIDYLQLAKYNGKWMILHVLWQSPPKALKSD